MGALQVTEAAELPPISDHTVMMTTVHIQQATTQAPAWEFRSAASLFAASDTQADVLALTANALQTMLG